MTTSCSLDPQAIAEEANRELDGAPAHDIVRWAVDHFGSGFCVLSSMQDAVLVHLASTVRPGVDVVFLDTGYHFAETLGTRDALASIHDINLITVRPKHSVLVQDLEYGPRLYERDPDKCCAMRKVAPMDEALEGYRVWATGARRVEAPSRANTQVVSYDAKRNMIKIAPLAAWSDDDVAKYVANHGLLTNPLQSIGYPSIGCEPCTRRVAPGEDPRAGRWADSTKTECGVNQ